MHTNQLGVAADTALLQLKRAIYPSDERRFFLQKRLDKLLCIGYKESPLSTFQG